MTSKRRRNGSLQLNPEQRGELERWVRGRTTPQRVVARSRIVLALADGLSHAQVSAQLRTTRQTVRLWKQRFVAGGPQALAVDASGRGRKSRIDSTVVMGALQEANGKRPSVRALARQLGTSASSIHRALSKKR